jgi:hypothetical protein
MKPLGSFEQRTDPRPASSQVIPFVAGNADKSGRALVQCAAHQLEKKLGEILQEFLRSGGCAERLLKGPSAPLSRLSSRLLACHALALIDDHELHDGDLISRICDDIHRSPSASLATEPVAAMCRRLHFRARQNAATALDDFSSAVAALLAQLKDRPFHVGGEKRFLRPWPA